MSTLPVRLKSSSSSASSHISPLIASGFEQLDKSVYLYIPRSTPLSLSTESTDPEIILFFGWGNAGPKAIVKYTAEYQRIYPQTRILLFLTTFADLFLHSSTHQAESLDPVVELLLSMVRDSSNNAHCPRILVHLFSNAGSYKFRELCRYYRQTATSIPKPSLLGDKSAEQAAVLPANLIVLDSAPGRPNFRGRMVGMRTQLPRQAVLYWLGSGLLFLMMCVAALLGMVFQWNPLLNQVWNDLNNTTSDAQFVDGKARRLYMYSKKDELIDWRDVVQHASDAETKGFRVQVEEFVDSKHVAHVLVDRKRYWDLIRNEWKGFVEYV